MLGSSGNSSSSSSGGSRGGSSGSSSRRSRRRRRSKSRSGKLSAASEVLQLDLGITRTCNGQHPLELRSRKSEALCSVSDAY